MLARGLLQVQMSDAQASTGAFQHTSHLALAVILMLVVEVGVDHPHLEADHACDHRPAHAGLDLATAAGPAGLTAAAAAIASIQLSGAAAPTALGSTPLLLLGLACPRCDCLSFLLPCLAAAIPANVKLDALRRPPVPQHQGAVLDLVRLCDAAGHAVAEEGGHGQVPARQGRQGQREEAGNGVCWTNGCWQAASAFHTKSRQWTSLPPFPSSRQASCQPLGACLMLRKKSALSVSRSRHASTAAGRLTMMLRSGSTPSRPSTVWAYLRPDVAGRNRRHQL